MNPNNYVNFNNELWRIIGLVNTPEGQRIKLIRNESIGSYSWDTSESSINYGWGVNEWSTSDMMNLLNNGAYYNRTSGTCYRASNNTTTECDFSNTGLTNNAKGMIDMVTWNLGSNDGTTYTGTNINTNIFYNLERSNNTGNICSNGTYCTDTIPRTTIWVGQVGLMYPSDYGYATSGGSTTDRVTCLNTVLFSWNGLSDCKENDWLFKGINQWTLTPFVSSGNASSVFEMVQTGLVHIYQGFGGFSSLPTIYLKESVEITSGNGSIDSPFELSV